MPKELTMDDKFELLLQALVTQQSSGITKETLAEILASNATAVQKAMKPENDTHPGVSCFSKPGGDLKNPKAALPHEFFWNGYPMHKFPETEHWRELELACQIVPGEYTVIRTDGSRMPVEVSGEKDADGKLTKVQVKFTVTRDEKALVPPKMVTMYQILHNEHPKKAFVEAMTEWIQMVMGAEEVPA